MKTGPVSNNSRTQRVFFAVSDAAERIAPLVAGYLQAFACTDPIVEANWQFEQFVSVPQKIGPDAFMRTLLEADADVYAFSCYVWNMGLIKRALVPLLRRSLTPV